MKCPSCGTKNKDGMKFCKICGASLETTNNNTTNESTDSKQFVFSPQITIEGSASREDVDNALSLSMEQFRELMEQYIAEKDRVSFA